ncbi:MAG TPA: FAD-binding protein [Geminicoccaceae bacterium]|nr:FAD-binding protein [Geminicoccus sp.]HMU50723.1 FAD-binding protein [Geminicoccaceae bacterium]
MQVFAPTRLTELEQVVAWAVAEQAPLEVIGLGSKRRLGRPVRAEAELRLDQLGGIAMYEPDELVMSAAAATPLATIEAELAERSQELAFEPADYGLILGGEPGRQSIGGVFACNIAGPRRLKAGAARDHLLGLQCVTGHGQTIKTGGRVMKNVTGYDLCKLLAGSYGTLAVASHLTFKVLPAAADSATLLLAGADEAVLLATLRQAMGTSGEVSSAALLPESAARRSTVPAIAGSGRPVACLRFEGTTVSIAYRIDKLERLCTRPGGLGASRLDAEASRILWREIRDVRLLDPALPLLWRISCPPTAAAEVVAAAASLGAELLLDWAGGLVWAALADAGEDAGSTVLRGAIASCGGHATLVRGPAELRGRIAPFQPQPAALAALSQRVKQGFDPGGVLNPGRMYAGV